MMIWHNFSPFHVILIGSSIIPPPTDHLYMVFCPYPFHSFDNHLNPTPSICRCPLLLTCRQFYIWNMEQSRRLLPTNQWTTFDFKYTCIVDHNQNQDVVGVYFIRLKSLPEEVDNFRPRCTCGNYGCNGVQEIEKYFQDEYIMHFYHEIEYILF